MDAGSSPARLVVVGAGNIGSHLLPHLARMGEVGAIVVIDGDRYEEHNLAGQDIARADVGRSKARVQATRLRRIRPDLAVAAIEERVEALPPGLLQADAILAAVDNRRARQEINEIAWRLGEPWIDAAVDAEGLFVRVATYVPAADAACLECGWSDSDYDALEQNYPCARDGGGSGMAGVSPTGAPSALGAVAAGLQALTLRDLLSAASRADVAGRQTFVDLRHHQHYRSTLPPNRSCRRTPHQPWNPVAWAVDPRQVRLGDLLGRCALPGAERAAGNRIRELRVNNLRWASRLVCGSCGVRRSTLLLLRGDLLAVVRRCPACRGRMVVAGMDVASSLTAEDLERRPARSLHDLGVRRGDILTFRRDDGVDLRARIIGDWR